jgi:hypothetical protein
VAVGGHRQLPRLHRGCVSVMSQTCTAPPRGAFDYRVSFWIAVASLVFAGFGYTPPGAQPVPAAGQAASMFSAEEVCAIKAASIALWRAGEDVAAIKAGRRQAEQPACGPNGACRIAPDRALAQWRIRWP